MQKAGSCACCHYSIVEVNNKTLVGWPNGDELRILEMQKLYDVMKLKTQEMTDNKSIFAIRFSPFVSLSCPCLPE